MPLSESELKPRCFVIMPIATPEKRPSAYADDPVHFDHVLEHLFRPAVEDAGFDLVSPRSRGGEIIHSDIIRNLRTAELVLADLSTLNPNVFFELGIRVACNLPVALVCDRTTSKLPFDAAILNCHWYDESLSGWSIKTQIQLLIVHICETVSGAEGRNALWRHFGSHAVNSDVGDVDPVALKLDRLLEVLGVPSPEGSTEPPVSRRPRPDPNVVIGAFLARCDEMLVTFQLKIRLISAAGRIVRLGLRDGGIRSNQVDQISLGVHDGYIRSKQVDQIAHLGRALGLQVEFDPEALKSRLPLSD